jgi:hypothetical protein
MLCEACRRGEPREAPVREVVCIKEHAGGCQEAGGSLYMIEERINIGTEGVAEYDGRRWVVTWYHGAYLSGALSLFDTNEEMAQYVRPLVIPVR